MDTRTEITLKEEHMQEILARQFAIQGAIDTYGRLLLQAQQQQSCGQWIRDAVQHALCKNVPVSHEEYKERMDACLFLEKGSRTDKEEAERTRKIVEFLQESLTFFLAEQYSFDPLGEPWTLSVERKVLIRGPGKDAL